MLGNIDIDDAEAHLALDKRENGRQAQKKNEGEDTQGQPEPELRSQLLECIPESSATRAPVGEAGTGRRGAILPRDRAGRAINALANCRSDASQRECPSSPSDDP